MPDPRTYSANSRSGTAAAHAVNPNRLIDLEVASTADTNCIDARAADITRARQRRTTYGEHTDAAIGGVADITKPGDTGKVPAAVSLDAIGITGTGLAHNPRPARAALAENTDRRIGSRHRAIHADVLATGVNKSPTGLEKPSRHPGDAHYTAT
jgi:hypothetical protein